MVWLKQKLLRAFDWPAARPGLWFSIGPTLLARRSWLRVTLRLLDFLDCPFQPKSLSCCRSQSGLPCLAYMLQTCAAVTVNPWALLHAYASCCSRFFPSATTQNSLLLFNRQPKRGFPLQPPSNGAKRGCTLDHQKGIVQ